MNHETTEADLNSADRVNIAILEDDIVVANLITAVFDEVGWNYQHFTYIESFVSNLNPETYDLMLLDWSLPDGEADVVIQQVRNELEMMTPIIIESANGDEEQIVRALEMGADDYVIKPLRMFELRARISALLRPRGHPSEQSLTLGEYRWSVTEHEFYLQDDKLELSKLEFSLARYFFEHFNELISRDQLLNDVWNRNKEVDTRTVDAHVSRLRKKLRFEQNTGYQISSLRGYGYRLETI